MVKDPVSVSRNSRVGLDKNHRKLSCDVRIGTGTSPNSHVHETKANEGQLLGSRSDYELSVTQ